MGLFIGVAGLPEPLPKYSVIRCDGKVWSPSKKQFLDGDKATDALRPLIPIQGPNHKGCGVAYDPDIPEMTPDEQGAIVLHGADGQPYPGIEPIQILEGPRAVAVNVRGR